MGMDIREDLVGAVAGFVGQNLTEDDRGTEYDVDSPFVRRVQEVAARHGVEAGLDECRDLVNSYTMDE